MIVTNLFGSHTSLIHINGNNIHALNLNQFFPLIFDGGKLSGLAVLGLILFIGIPVVQIIWLAIRILFSIPKQSATTRSIMAGFWIVGLICLGYLGTQVASNFHSQSYNTTKVELPTATDTLSLELTDNDYFNTHQRSVSYHYDDELEALLTTEVSLDIQKATGDQFELKMKKSSNGESQKQAKINASKIHYNYTIEDDILYFNNYLNLEEDEGFRFQSLELTLYVPEGKTVYLDNSLKHFIYNVDNVTDTYDERMVNHSWTMEYNGLTCTDCNE